MALPKRLIRSERGKGINVYEDQLNLLTSEGTVLEGANGAWHLELSEIKHVYLTRRGPDLRLILKEFHREAGTLRPTGHWVEMDKQQLTDFIFMSLDAIYTCRRNDITTLYEREVLCASGATLTGMVRDYDSSELRQLTSFPEIPELAGDYHIGKLLFIHAKSRFRSLELRQYRPGVQEEKPNGAETVTLSAIESAKATRSFNMLREELGNFYRGLPSLLQRWSGLLEMVCCSQHHREPLSGDFLDDVMRSCLHCCPFGKLVDQLPVSTAKSRHWMDSDVYGDIPVQEIANGRWLSQVGYGALWGYKVSQIAKIVAPRKIPLLESIVTVCAKLVDVDVRLMVDGGRPAFKEALASLLTRAQFIPAEVTQASPPAGAEAVSGAKPDEIDAAYNSSGEEDLSETDSCEEIENAADSSSPLNKGFNGEDSHISDAFLHSVADEIEKQGIFKELAKMQPAVVSRGAAERAVEAVTGPPNVEIGLSEGRKPYDLLKTLLANPDAKSNLPEIATLPEPVKWSKIRHQTQSQVPQLRTGYWDSSEQQQRQQQQSQQQRQQQQPQQPQPQQPQPQQQQRHKKEKEAVNKQKNPQRQSRKTETGESREMQDYVTPKSTRCQMSSGKKRNGGPPVQPKPKAAKKLRFENEPPPLLNMDYEMVSDDGEDHEDGPLAASTPKRKHKMQAVKSFAPSQRNKLTTKPSSNKSRAVPDQEGVAKKPATARRQPLCPILIN